MPLSTNPIRNIDHILIIITLTSTILNIKHNQNEVSVLKNGTH
jgi:hypothetical protein